MPTHMFPSRFKALIAATATALTIFAVLAYLS